MDAKLAPGGKSMTGMTFWLGTDDQGRDMLSGILYGLRISLGVGALSTLVALAIGMVVGLVAAYAGGWVDGAHHAARRPAALVPVDPDRAGAARGDWARAWTRS